MQMIPVLAFHFFLTPLPPRLFYWLLKCCGPEPFFRSLAHWMFFRCLLFLKDVCLQRFNPAPLDSYLSAPNITVSRGLLGQQQHDTHTYTA